jgi:hypothetical protein
MTFDLDPTMVPDHDADKVLPATYRITLWDSRFAQGMGSSAKR